jgi:hypothetical protein
MPPGMFSAIPPVRENCKALVHLNETAGLIIDLHGWLSMAERRWVLANSACTITSPVT